MERLPTELDLQSLKQECDEGDHRVDRRATQPEASTTFGWTLKVTSLAQVWLLGMSSGAQ